jgi:hypothetical protein
VTGFDPDIPRIPPLEPQRRTYTHHCPECGIQSPAHLGNCRNLYLEGVIRKAVHDAVREALATDDA